jgi:hypothetical protein
VTEQQYIDATNLAKIRAAMAVLREYIPMTAGEKFEIGAPMHALSLIHDRLASVVKIRPDVANRKRGAS